MPITDPNNALGTNAAYSGRTSVNAFNDVAAVLSRGVLSGWNCVPGTGLKVKIGGDASVRDVAIAEDNAGNKTTINNRTKSAIEVTLPGAPGANSRIDAIVAYVDPTIQGSADAADNPSVVGLVVVSGAAAVAPQMPSDTEIRSAITGDGANGTSAFYVVLAAVTMKTSMTTVTANEIRQVDRAVVGTDNVDFTTIAPGSIQVIRLGNRKIMFGRTTVNSVPSRTDKGVTIPYPEAFNATPIIVATVANWVARPIVCAYPNSSSPTMQFRLIVNHEQGDSQDVPINWVAIG